MMCYVYFEFIRVATPYLKWSLVWENQNIIPRLRNEHINISEEEVLKYLGKDTFGYFLNKQSWLIDDNDKNVLIDGNRSITYLFHFTWVPWLFT